MRQYTKTAARQFGQWVVRVRDNGVHVMQRGKGHTTEGFCRCKPLVETDRTWPPIVMHFAPLDGWFGDQAKALRHARKVADKVRWRSEAIREDSL